MCEATAPHIVDPKNPGAVDEIIHLGDYWDIEKMEANKDAILTSNTEVGRLFARAYKFLESARPIAEDIINKNKEGMDFGKVNFETNKLIKEIFENISMKEKEGKERHLFGSAITPEGYVEFTDTIMQAIGKVYYIKGDMGTGKSTLIGKIYKQAIGMGLDVEIYHTPFIPEKIESIVIKEINVGITISNMYKNNNHKDIDLDQYLDTALIEKYKEEIEYDKKIFDNLMEQGISNIKSAKKEHDAMEKYYIPNMDFSEIDVVRKEIVKRILKYAK